MKKIVILILTAMMLTSDSYAFDYSVLNDMTVEELEKLEEKVQDAIVTAKYESGVYPYKIGVNYIDQKEYLIGETWEEPGFMRLTINSVTKTDARDEYSQETPEAVYLVNYTFENLGFTRDPDGLYVWIGIHGSVVDADGEVGYNAGSVDGEKICKDTPVGARCTVVEPIGLNHDGDFKIVFTFSGNEYEKHQVTFLVKVEQ